MNGRIGKDKNVGAFTFREARIVDYVISSLDLRKYLSNFEIHKQSKLFSDVHILVGVTVSNGIDTVEQYKKQKPPANIVYKITKWDPEQTVEFVNNIGNDKVLILIV